MNPTLRRLAPGVLPLALATLVSAQQIGTFDGPYHTESWTLMELPGTFGRAVSARLTPDPRPELVFVDGLQVVVLADSLEKFAPSPLQLAANDLDVLPGAGSTGLDRVAVVTAAGLHFVDHDPLANAFTWTFWTAGPWAGARTVRSADLDGDGDADLVGVSADGLSVSTLMGTPGGGFAAGPSFSVVNPIRVCVPLEWDGDAGLELGLLTDLGIEVYEQDSSLVDLWPTALVGGTLSILRNSGQSQDRLAWITAHSPPQPQYLRVLSPGSVDDQVELGALDAFALVPADYDGDGDDDLTLSHRYSYDLLWLENERSAAAPYGPSFTQHSSGKMLFRVGPPGAGAPENDAWPVMDDLDGDGDMDLFFASEPEQELTFTCGDTVDESLARPAVSSVAYEELGGEFVLLFTVQEFGLAPEATELEVDVWTQSSLQQDVGAVGSRHLFPITGTWPMVLEVPAPGLVTGMTDVTHYQVRGIRTVGTSEVESYVTLNLTFAGTDSLSAAVAALPYAGDSLAVEGTLPQGPGINPTTTERKSINPFPPSSPPYPINN